LLQEGSQIPASSRIFDQVDAGSGEGQMGELEAALGERPHIEVATQLLRTNEGFRPERRIFLHRHVGGFQANSGHQPQFDRAQADPPAELSLKRLLHLAVKAVEIEEQGQEQGGQQEPAGQSQQPPP
jgi:hypothetical protein